MDVTYDLRTRTTLVCGALAVLIALNILARGRVRRLQLLGAAFAGDVGLWYLSQSMFGLFPVSVWERLRVVLAVLLPVFAVNLFEGVVPQEDVKGPRLRLGHLTVPLAIPMVGLALSPYLRWFPARVVIFLYVFTLFAISLYQLYRRGHQSQSRATQRRVTLLVVIGALSGVFTVADFVWVLGYVPAYSPPPVGVVISVVFLYLLSHALRHERLLDLYEMLGKLLVSTAVGFLIGLVFYLLISVAGPFATMYLNAVLAAIVVLVLFQPLREYTEQQIQRLVLRERRNLERAVAAARKRLVHVLEVSELGPVVVGALEQSRRATAGALYLLQEDGNQFEAVASYGAGAPHRIEYAAARAILELLERGTVVLDDLRRQLREGRVSGAQRAALQAAVGAAEVLGKLNSGVVLAIRREGGELVGMLVVADERIREAFSPEDVALLEALAAQIGVVVENSRLYAQLEIRDRLAVLGRLAAGLAHEIRNPLGAIKGAAQLLGEPGPDAAPLDESSREFVNIILEEVDRLDQVVGSVLALARQSTGPAPPIDVTGVIARTVQLMSAEWDSQECGVEVELGAEAPRVAIAPDQLQQVLMNLLRNAMEAMGYQGRVRIGTRSRRAGREELCEIAVSDTGPGISATTRQSMFMPFFTTKHDGTGLGLPISQRIVQSVGGRIEVRTEEGKGSTFCVVLPVVNEAGEPAPDEAPPKRPSRAPRGAGRPPEPSGTTEGPAPTGSIDPRETANVG